MSTSPTSVPVSRSTRIIVLTRLLWWNPSLTNKRSLINGLLRKDLKCLYNISLGLTLITIGSVPSLTKATRYHPHELNQKGIRYSSLFLSQNFSWGATPLGCTRVRAVGAWRPVLPMKEEILPTADSTPLTTPEVAGNTFSTWNLHRFSRVCDAINVPLNITKTYKNTCMCHHVKPLPVQMIFKTRPKKGHIADSFFLALEKMFLGPRKKKKLLSKHERF